MVSVVGKHYLFFNNLSVLHLQRPIRDVKPAVVMGDGDHGFALGFELRQQRFIEVAAELRGLLGSSFIKDSCAFLTVYAPPFRSNTQ